MTGKNVFVLQRKRRSGRGPACTVFLPPQQSGTTRSEGTARPPATTNSRLWRAYHRVWKDALRITAAREGTFLFRRAPQKHPNKRCCRGPFKGPAPAETCPEAKGRVSANAKVAGVCLMIFPRPWHQGKRRGF